MARESAATQWTLEERSAERRRRMEVHRAASFAEAEAWDLDFWQRRTPEERLSALVDLRLEAERIATIRAGRAPDGE